MNKRYLPLLSLLAIIPAILFLTATDSLSVQNNPISISDSISISDIVDFQTTQKSNPKVERLGISGHLVFILRDSDGNIKYYSQGDNVIVNNGENCVSKLLFQSVTGAAGNAVCAGANTVGFRYIGLDEGAGPYAEDDGGLEDPADSAGLSTPLFGTIVWTNSTGTSSSATAVITATFTNAGASEVIYGAGLFNSTTVTEGMFAHKLAAAPATVDNGNTLTAEWTFVIGGT